MKSNFKFLSSLLLILFVSFTQLVFSDILIRKDNGDPGTVPMGVTRLNSMSSTQSFIPVTADIQGNELFVNFINPVGTASVSVVDLSGNCVYHTVVDTNTTSEISISLDGLSAGKYTLKITYVFTKLKGDFSL